MNFKTAIAAAAVACRCSHRTQQGKQRCPAAGRKMSVGAHAGKPSHSVSQMIVPAMPGECRGARRCAMLLPAQVAAQNILPPSVRGSAG